MELCYESVPKACLPNCAGGRRPDDQYKASDLLGIFGRLKSGTDVPDAKNGTRKFRMPLKRSLHTALGQVVPERGPDHIIHGFGRDTASRPALSREVGILNSPAKT